MRELALSRKLLSRRMLLLVVLDPGLVGTEGVGVLADGAPAMRVEEDAADEEIELEATLELELEPELRMTVERVESWVFRRSMGRMSLLLLLLCNALRAI